jgi:hypothetical protein
MCIRIILNSKNLPFSVPQGSILGAPLYIDYASTIKDILPRDIELHAYADDHAIKTAFDPKKTESQHQTRQLLEKTMENIKHWMDLNRLKMNDTKTANISKVDFEHLQMSDCEINT